MDRRGACWSPTLPIAPPRGSGTGSAGGGLAGARPGEIGQPELADLHLVTAGQGGDVDRLAVDVGAVEAAHVVHGEAAALAVELHVRAADRHVVEEDVAVGVPTGGGGGPVGQGPAARGGGGLCPPPRPAPRGGGGRAPPR